MAQYSVKESKSCYQMKPRKMKSAPGFYENLFKRTRQTPKNVSENKRRGEQPANALSVDQNVLNDHTAQLSRIDDTFKKTSGQIYGRRLVIELKPVDINQIFAESDVGLRLENPKRLSTRATTASSPIDDESSMLDVTENDDDIFHSFSTNRPGYGTRIRGPNVPCEESSNPDPSDPSTTRKSVAENEISNVGRHSVDSVSPIPVARRVRRTERWKAIAKSGNEPSPRNQSVVGYSRNAFVTSTCSTSFEARKKEQERRHVLREAVEHLRGFTRAFELLVEMDDE